MIEITGPLDQEPLYRYACPCGWVSFTTPILTVAQAEEQAHIADTHTAAPETA